MWQISNCVLKFFDLREPDHDWRRLILGGLSNKVSIFSSLMYKSSIFPSVRTIVVFLAKNNMLYFNFSYLFHIVFMVAILVLGTVDISDAGGAGGQVRKSAISSWLYLTSVQNDKIHHLHPIV
ncbi:hypothetical protein NPIL_328211 [Nephila pilipes]|uniref:Uncharacterized protein n=1 Tax=Nephila pilipes TaxID=299642 RepID=A0A8X6PCS1_NEPPI|nr:hypothetical protein NPIL_328211 [Nephila pilipes]